MRKALTTLVLALVLPAGAALADEMAGLVDAAIVWDR